MRLDIIIFHFHFHFPIRLMSKEICFLKNYEKSEKHIILVITKIVEKKEKKKTQHNSILMGNIMPMYTGFM